MTNKRLQMVIEGGMVAALCMALSYIPMEGPFAGFDLSLGMILATIYSIRWGTGAGLLACLVWGLLHFALGKYYFLSPIQVVCEYVFAFMCAGFGGVLSKQVKKAIVDKSSTLSLSGLLICSAIIGTAARWIWHFIAGVAFWGDYAPEGVSPLMNSLTLNGLSFIANVIYVSVLLILLAGVRKQFFLPEHSY